MEILLILTLMLMILIPTFAKVKGHVLCTVVLAYTHETHECCA